MLGVLAMPSNINLEGVWTGHYHYRGVMSWLAPSVKFHVVFQKDDGGIRGRIYEPNTFGRRSAEHLEADIRDLEVRDGILRFTKQYDGSGGASHSIDYEGSISADGLSVQGTWKIGWRGSGTFEMAKETGAVLEQFTAGSIPAFERPKTPRWPFFLVLGILLTVVLTSVWFISLSPEARDAHDFIAKMPLERITEIRLEPSGRNSPATTVIHITSREQITEIANAFRMATSISPNHPHTQWSVTIRFITPEREYGGHLSQTSNHGVLFWYSSGVTSGWNYGTYRNDALAGLIKRIIDGRKEQ
jgi:hypothetical protein